MAAVKTPLIETRGLSRRFGGLKAVDGVDFSLPEGEIRALIGPMQKALFTVAYIIETYTLGI